MKIAPRILSAYFGALGEAIARDARAPAPCPSADAGIEPIGDPLESDRPTRLAGS